VETGGGEFVADEPGRDDCEGDQHPRDSPPGRACGSGAGEKAEMAEEKAGGGP
jgi:hypothetical protein